MEIQTAITILETKKLSCCHQKDFLQAVDMAISALRQQNTKTDEYRDQKAVRASDRP